MALNQNQISKVVKGILQMNTPYECRHKIHNKPLESTIQKYWNQASFI